MNEPSDAVIIGAGVVGSAIAYFLASQGVRVTVLEKGAPGSGTSSASGGAVALLSKTPGAKLELAKESLSLLHELAVNFDYDFELRCDGSIMVARTEDEYMLLEKKVQQLRASDVDITLLDSRSARDSMPALTDSVVGAAISPADCTVNPLLLVAAYLHEARKLGANVRTYSEVTEIKVHDGAVTGVRTNGEKIETRVVIDAAGVWAKEIARLAGVQLPIQPRKGEIVVTEAAPPLLRGELFSASYLTSKETPQFAYTAWTGAPLVVEGTQAAVAATQTARGNLLIGSTRSFSGYDRQNTIDGIQVLLKRMIELVPAVADLHVIRAYSGLRPSTPDGLPLVDKAPGVNGLFVAAGHEGDGIALSAITGKIMAGILTGGEPHPLHSSLSLARFQECQEVG